MTPMLQGNDQKKLQAAIGLQQADKFEEAANLYLELIKSNPKNFYALHFLGIIEATVGHLEEAKRLLDRSLLITPPSIQFIENYATILVHAADYETAIQKCQHGFQIDKNNISLLYVSAIALFKLDKFQESIAQFDRLLALQPNHIAALNERGSALAKISQYEAALASINRALALDQKNAEAHLNSGNAYGELQRYDEAIKAFDQAIALNPASATAWLGRGNSLKELKRYHEALSAYAKALSLKPELAEAWLGQGTVLLRLRRYQEGFAAYQKALSLKPDLADAWLGRGNVLFELKRYDEALQDYDKALSITPELVQAWLSRGQACNNRKCHEEAAHSFTKLLELDPAFPFVTGMLLHQKMLSCDWSGLASLIAQINSDLASGKRTAEPFGYQAIGRDAGDCKRCALIYAADKFPPLQTQLWGGGRYNNEKIRIGYLSGEFRRHAMSLLMVELFELHDKERFEIYAFDNGWDDRSEIRKRINKAFNSTIDISRVDDLQVATTIKEMQIDILVNLNGHFGQHRTGVFSYKPSPVQVSYLGFPGTMGAGYIDYLIADPCVIPSQQQDCYVEKITYLPETYQPNDTKRFIAEHAPTRKQAMLPESGFVFCCFNNNYKITPEIFEVWMRLLDKVEGSVLWLLEDNPAVSRNLRQEASGVGIAPERLVFAPRMDLPEHLARHRLADLFLDTLPYNAHTTASDALWAGLPLLTCLGSTFPGRVAASLLQAIGVPDLIAHSLKDYEAMAVRLAQEPELLASFRSKLVQNRETYPLFDSQRFTRHIEAAYITMWERHQRGEPPAGFAVTPLPSRDRSRSGVSH
jgi:protein O-GlcNAc transferase